MSETPNHYVSLTTNYVIANDGAKNVKMLVQATVVNWRGATALDIYVQPTAPVVDYCTSYHGLDQRHFTGPQIETFQDARARVQSEISGKILVGYCLWESLALCDLTHPAVATRDVATYTPFRHALGLSLDSNAEVQPLKVFMSRLMRREIQPLLYDTLESARAAMDLFRSHRAEWEGVIEAKGWPCVILSSTLNSRYT